MDYNYTPYVISACCVLNNITETRGDPVPYINTNEHDDLEQPNTFSFDGNESTYAKTIRAKLLEKLINTLSSTFTI